MKYIQCPAEYLAKEATAPSLFLAGGITGCLEWQTKLLLHLEKENVVIINPRRKDFDVSNPNMEREQIEWEYRHLNRSDIVSFWFPCETLCPITLFELADMVALSKHTNLKVLVGCHPEYKRIRDIKIQLGLRDKRIEVVESLEELADQIKAALK